MATFYGNHVQTIDSKRRLPITAAFRELIDAEQDGCGFVMLLWPDGRLRLYPNKYYVRLIASARRKSPSAAEFRKMAEFLSEGHTLKPDAQGRVVLPADVIAEAKLPDEVVLRGIDDHIELWRVEEWKAKRAVNDMPDMDEMLHQAAQSLGETDAPQVW